MTTRRRFIRHLPLMLAGLAMGLGVFVSVDGFRSNKAEETTAYYTPSTHYEVSDTAAELTSYYSSISDSDTGTSLLSKLQSLNSTKRKKTMGYSTIGTGTDGAVIYTDYDLNSTATDSNGQTYGTKVASFYTKTAATEWNREHVWPKSHGGNKVEDDILHTRPTISSENSSRGNSFYVEGLNNSSSGWDPYTAGYDIECRGECARIILYSVVAYSGFSLSDANSHSTSNANPDYMMGNMNTLIKWHFDYAPNVYEINRNNGAEYLQGNRNPFVDHPEYVARIWSSFNSTVTSLCTQNSSTYSSWTPGSYCDYGSNTPVGTDGVTISKTSASLTVGGTTTVSATSSNNSQITWTTSNSSVASLSSGTAASGTNITITANAAGTATITAKATINNTQYSKTCAVTVIASGGSGGSDSLTIAVSDIPSAYASTSFTSGNYSFGCSNIGNSYTSGAMQWKSGQGYMYNTTSIESISSISIATVSGGTFSGTIYTGSSSHPTSGTSYSISNGNTVNITGSPSYFTIQAGSVSGGAKCGDITITYGSSSTKTLSSISVSTAPTKTTYTAGEYFDPTGLVIRRTYSDSTYDTYAYAGHTSEFTFSPTTSTALTTSNASVTITYGGKNCSQAITVNAAPVLSSISISGCTTSFVEGDTFSFGGTVTANYSGGSQSNVTSQATFSGYNMTTLGSQTVTVSYGGKSKTYTITVNQGTLSSIAVSGQTTTYIKNATFSFDGVCTATMANGYQKNVTPTSVSSPDMSTVGSKTITVSLTYNGTSKSTTYSITVNPSRVVLEASTISKNGTITWPSSATPNITGTLTNVSATASGKTIYESSSLRLGTGSGGGTLTVSATEKITSLDISAKYYSSSYSTSVLKVDGQSVSSLSSNYSTYSVTLTTGKTSFTILTQDSDSRVNIESITLYSVVTTETDITTTSDCLGLESFIENNLHMDYTQNLGYCKDNTHHYYSTAKSAFNNLNAHQRSLFVGNSAYASEFARLSAWASANGESFNSNNQLSQRSTLSISPVILEKNSSIIILVLFTLMGATAIGVYVYLSKKKTSK